MIQMVVMAAAVTPVDQMLLLTMMNRTLLPKKIDQIPHCHRRCCQNYLIDQILTFYCNNGEVSFG